MILLDIFDTTLPLVNPVLRFFLILVIILFVPIIFDKLRIPHLLGLIIAGAVIGSNGFHLIDRDSSIILSGTAGLLYIMFLAGLEINLSDFKKNAKKSLVFGFYTFSVPMVLGTFSGYYILQFSLPTSILLASMFASHTLITYPIISKLGLSKNKVVSITIGGTLITDILALLILAVIVGMASGEVGASFWVRLGVSIVSFAVVMMFGFPMIGRWFFKRFDDPVSQYIFVLLLVFLGAVLAELAGIEAIIGAFLAGLALNKLIPHTSPLMNRIDFVGTAIFIPFFLIGVGMLIDYRVFFKDVETIFVAIVMIVVATTAKFLAAYLTQKTYKFSRDQRRLIFGLSNAQAAATLAAVIIGYNIVIGETEAGVPIRLLNEAVLNGTILMILVTCTIASFVTQKGAHNIALAETAGWVSDVGERSTERILIPISNNETTEELINLGVTIKAKNNKDGLYALCIIDNGINDSSAEKRARKNLNQASITASATDNSLHEILRYDVNIANGIISVIRENRITDLILGLHKKQGISDTFLGDLTEGILAKCNTTTLIYHSVQPFATIKRHMIIVPDEAEKEIGFPFWISKIWNIALNSPAPLHFFTSRQTATIINEMQSGSNANCVFEDFDNWDDILTLTNRINQDDNLIIVLSRKDKPSFHDKMPEIPSYLNQCFKQTNYVLIYPIQSVIEKSIQIDLKNPTWIEPIEKLDRVGKWLKGILRRE